MKGDAIEKGVWGRGRDTKQEFFRCKKIYANKRYD
jgi:hypothetical protein